MKLSLPKRLKDPTGWYNTIVKQAGLAEHSAVRGCMIIRPYGFALWERIRNILDKTLRATGHVNVYFPLLIPLSYMTKEASHVQAFAKECAVVTHYRLKENQDHRIIPDPDALLEEPLVIRPTSEALVWHAYKDWIQSHRDLPLLFNQWNTVVRWEMRTRPFLRTTEILWQEGHTAHATAQEAHEKSLQILDMYASFIQNYMAIPVHKGRKTAQERFAGADTTYTLELLMPGNKALQAGTSHFLGQRFAKAFDVRFVNATGQHEYAWGTSWGLTTRLIGALVMAHGDDQGLVLPPKLAPIQVVIVPIVKGDATLNHIGDISTTITNVLATKGITAKFDADMHHTPGWKFAEYERRGVPIRLSIGPHELTNHTVELVRRDTGSRSTVPVEQLATQIPSLLTAIQASLYNRALQFRKTHTLYPKTYSDFKEALQQKQGFVVAYWDGTTATEQAIKAATKASIRCLPLQAIEEQGHCIYSGKLTTQRVLFAQAY